jgi:hypothetical protein
VNDDTTTRPALSYYSGGKAQPKAASGLDRWVPDFLRVLALWFIHSSGRYDRPLRSLQASLTRLRRLGALVTGTEVSGRPDPKFWLLARGWGYAHLKGAGASECYATWDTNQLTLEGRPFARKLSDKTYDRDAEHGGQAAPFVHALVVKLRPVLAGKRAVFVVVVHMPVRNTDQRRKVWASCATGLRLLESDLVNLDPDADVVFVGDWNADYRSSLDRFTMDNQLAKPLRMVQAWTGRVPSRGGTHGASLIDGAILPRAILAGCELLPDDPSSDHRPFRYRVRCRKAGKR